MQDFLKRCKNSVLEGDRGVARQLATAVVREGRDILDAVENGFTAGIRDAGDRWQKGEYFLPELAFSAEAMKAAMEVLQPAMKEGIGGGQSRATVVIGTVQGDIHDIGKSLVATMLSANGYHVFDVGSDIEHTHFIDEVVRHNPRFLCLSALLTTTMVGQRRMIELLQERRLRDDIKVIVGGAPTSAEWAREIGADGHADNAVEAVRVLDSLL